jgi:hypothetical protein
MLRTTIALSMLVISGCLHAQAQNVGEQKEILLESLSTHAEWNQRAFACEPQNSRDDRDWKPAPGWAIVSVRKVENEKNRGGGEYDLTEGGRTFPTIATVTSQFDQLLKLGRATKNAAAVQEITAIRDNWLKAREGIPAQNAAHYFVWANSWGTCQDQRGGSANFSFYGTERYVGHDDDLANVVRSLSAKYFPDL